MIEIKIRRFYRCDEGIVIPSRTYVIDECLKPPPPFNILAALEKLGAEVSEMPGTNWRLMTEAEVEEYCGTENDEEVVAIPL